MSLLAVSLLDGDLTHHSLLLRLTIGSYDGLWLAIGLACQWIGSGSQLGLLLEGPLVHVVPDVVPGHAINLGQLGAVDEALLDTSLLDELVQELLDEGC